MEFLQTSCSAEDDDKGCDKEGDELKNDQNISEKGFPEPTLPPSGDTSMISNLLKNLVSR